jgi:hypothetical protein
MLRLPLANLVALLAPVAVIGFGAGVLRALAQRTAAARRRRALQASWVLLLLAGVPLWLVAAALLGIW